MKNGTLKEAVGKWNEMFALCSSRIVLFTSYKMLSIHGFPIYKAMIVNVVNKKRIYHPNLASSGKVPNTCPSSKQNTWTIANLRNPNLKENP